MISRRIKGKMLYSVEEEITKAKKKLCVVHMNREYYIRQRKYGIHKVTERRKVNSLQYDLTEKPPSKSQLTPIKKAKAYSTINSETKNADNISYLRQ